MSKRAPRSTNDQARRDLPKPLELIRRLGFYPYAFISVGILASLYARSVRAGGGPMWADTLIWLSGLCFTTGVLWAVAKLAAGLFEKRPARGLIDGLAAGLVAGLVGGLLGYGRHPMETAIRTVLEGEDWLVISYNDPSYIRALWVLTFAFPISGVLGLACDLIHPDRKINWPRNIGLVILVGTGFLLLVGFGVFQFSPEMHGAGIKFSEILLISEVFVLTYAALLAFGFNWSLRKFTGRISVVVITMLAVRFLIFVIPANESPSGHLWDRTYPVSELRIQEFSMAVTIVLLCVWSIALYGLFYLDHPINRWADAKMGIRSRTNTDGH